MIEVVQPSCEGNPAYLSRGLRDALGSVQDWEPMGFQIQVNGSV